MRQNNKEIPTEIQDVGAEKKTNSYINAGCAASQVFCSFHKSEISPAVDWSPASYTSLLEDQRFRLFL